MKKTLQECKKMVAKENGYCNWENAIQNFFGTEYFTDLANKMYYEQNEWISVEDGLPDCINILAFTGGLKITLTFIDGIYYNNDGNVWCSPVTHWQKLPSPPESFCECGSQKDFDCKYCTSCNRFESI